MSISVFTPAPKPADEFLRSEAASTSPLLGTALSAYATSIARDTRDMFGARWSGVCLIFDEWQHVVASSGGMIGLYRRSTSISSYVVASPREPFCVLDTSRDERFAGNPFVTDGLIGFYAGAAIMDRSGYAIGALCVTDPNSQDAVDPDALRQLKVVAASLGGTL